VIVRFLAVRSQAFEQAPEERLVSGQACCPDGAGLGCELIDPRLGVCFFEVPVSAQRHGLLSASSGLIALVQAGRSRGRGH